MSQILKAVRGTRDLLPPETELWNRIEATARKVFARYHFGEIRTPIFEDTGLFARSVGEETDIVSKEMYTWEDRARAQSEKSQSLTLRPENTAGVVRAYIEHKLGESGQLQKLYYIGPQFRRERPQKGRYRQFWQIGAEVIGPPFAGSESPLRDAEVLEMLATLLDELHIEGWTLELNSVGSSADRAGGVGGRFPHGLRHGLRSFGRFVGWAGTARLARLQHAFEWRSPGVALTFGACPERAEGSALWLFRLHADLKVGATIASWPPPEPGGKLASAESSVQGFPAGSKIRRRTSKIPPERGHWVPVCLPPGWVIARLLYGELCPGGIAQLRLGVGCQGLGFGARGWVPGTKLMAER